MTDLYYLIPIGVLAGTSIAACVGWWRAQHNYEWAYEGWERACALHRTWREEAKVRADIRDADAARVWAHAVELDDQLRTIERKRSVAVSKGNHTRALKAQALRDATTAQLAGEVQAKARKLRVAA